MTNRIGELVNEVDPTAEFIRTMLAEEFRQLQSNDAVYSSDYTPDSFDDE